MAGTLTDRDNFIWLLSGLIFLLFSGAIFAQFDFEEGQKVVNISLMITLLVGVWTLETKKQRWMNPKIAMTLAIVILMVGDSIIESNFMAKGQLIGAFLFFSLTTFQAGNQVLFTGYVDTNKIIGAICVYILLGLVWAFAYLIVEAFIPGSLSGLTNELWQGNLQDTIYYSMVTLTTLGYGDITPEQPLVRFLAYMEAITGIFYTTVLVASLIGLRLADIQPEYEQKAMLDENRPEQS